MRKLMLTAAAGALVAPMAVHAQSDSSSSSGSGDCGEISIAQMNWAAAGVTTNVMKFILDQGYGCTTTLVPSDTIPAITSVSENGEPDIITNLWLNSGGEAYRKLEDNGTLTRVNKVLKPGGVEGWWVPTYLAEEHPELKTIEGVMEHPDWVGGRFNNCPDGWGCRVVNDNLIQALGMGGDGEDSLEIFNHGSGETLSASMGSAVENEEPWFGYQFGPTVALGKYDMTRVKIGEVKPEVHKANQNPDNQNPEVSDFTAAPILTSVTADFQESHPEVTEFLSNMSFETSTMSSLLAWQEENGASAEEVAVHFLNTKQDVWQEWINDEAQENLASVLNQS